MVTAKPATIDEYIAGFPENVQERLEKMRTVIAAAAPKAAEAITYAMPTFMFNKKHVIHFAAFKNHIGFYAAPTGHEAFKKELSLYKTGKGSVQFPHDQPLPLQLITRIVKFRMKAVAEKQAKK